jgi:hypothetical protein
MEAVWKGRETGLCERLFCTGSLISNLISSVLKYRNDRITRMLYKQPEILIAGGEIYATIKKTSKCEMNVLRGDQKMALRTNTKRSNRWKRGFLPACCRYGGSEWSLDLMNSFEVSISTMSFDWLVSLRRRDVRDFWCVAPG